jgi:tRNA-splicing ligase RtcB
VGRERLLGRHGVCGQLGMPGPTVHVSILLPRRAFSKVYEKSPEELDMHNFYDVSHNIAKIEKHVGAGKDVRNLLLH